ncbi:MAG: asparagine synthase (glutamine-hydrolyzing) [Acidobacteriota bacterium]
MCGITGFFGEDDPRGAPERLCSMTRTLRHRGPDTGASWLEAEAGVGLGHRRLSILDLSPAGAQPMHSHDERYVLSINGEIYNYPTLRTFVEQRRGGVAWRGHSDTEVLLELIAEIGVAQTLTRLDGMFAMAVYDRQDRRLTLARDPFGEKPLYYGRCGQVLLFGSELRPLLAYPGFAPPIDLGALADFFKYSYIPCPASIYEGVAKLPPAQYLEVTRQDIVAGRWPEPQAYWSPGEAALRSLEHPFAGSQAEALEQVRAVLLDSTARRMMSDVPLGSLLSGGIDSSIVTALMQASAPRPVRTFSIGMAVADFDEAAHARAVSRHLGTDHSELMLTPQEIQAAIPGMPAIYDEPFADSSQVPTYLVSRMAREEVTVALSGDGGDELFGGYNRYFYAARLNRWLGRIPGPARTTVSALLQALPMGAVRRAVALAGPLAPRELAAGRAPEKLQKLARILAADETSFHDRLLETTGHVEGVLAFDARPSILAARLERMADGLGALSWAERAMLLDVTNYLPDDLLAKVDRASMAVSLEVRTPFLNRALFELAWSLPWSMKVGPREGKRILRELLTTYVPRELVERPKSGFAMPIGRWLGSDLRDWAEASLSRTRLQAEGIFDVPEVRRRWAEHLAGRRDHDTFLWSVLMYQGWRESTAEKPEPTDSDEATS